MKNDAAKVQEHFHRTAAGFDSIYTGKKSPLGRVLDRVLRWDIQERMRLALEACRPVEGKSVLDLGCGTGRFCFPLARAGAGRVVGVDFAQGMIDRANDLAREERLDDRCTFLYADIMEYRSEEPYDCVLAIGLFDYIQDPRHMLAHLRTLTRGKAIMTFPRSDTWRAPVRKLRLGMLGCPVYFYNRKRIHDYLLMAGFVVKKIQRVGKLYFVEAM
ncbi:MAG: class I SAM-dependent methyltransferase [Candidatus Zixiibacteriota bacterium]|nr:MAG: class I SAM-dependent methyltransferase [candidate division Zixibacteria bacterium]